MRPGRAALREAKRRAAEALLGTLPLPGDEAAWAHAARAAARGRLLEMGAPGRRDEYWKYTDPTQLTQPLTLVVPGEAAPEVETQFGEVHPRRLRFVDGHFRPDLSDAVEDAGLAVSTLAEALKLDLTPARDLFGALEAAGHEKVARPLAALNTAVATEGAVIHVTGAAAQPLHIRADQTGEGLTMLHHLVRLEAGASLTLLQSGHVGNEVIEIEVGPGATLHHVRIQEDERPPAATHIFARLAGGAILRTFTLTADGTLTRNEVVVELVGDRAVGHVAGAVLGKGASHIDNTVFVTHTGEGGESRQVFKNVLADGARAVFQGKIFVRREAQKTDGYQISQSVLLSEGCEFDAKPELEIYADDVKCSHGSTTGQLEAEAMFYLRSRGVPREEAEAMLVEAFADAAFEEIADETIAEAMRGHVGRWMAERWQRRE